MSITTTSHLTTTLLITLLLSTTSASPLTLPPFLIPRGNTTHLAKPVAQKTPGTEGQIKCYSLPYGGIGFASHILTYYTLYCVSKGLRPWFPWRQLSRKWTSVYLACAMLVLTITVAVWTIVRCRDDWRVLLIAIWKLSLSVSLGCVCVHRTMIMVRDKKLVNGINAGSWGQGEYHTLDDDGDPGINHEALSYTAGKPLLWLILYLLGVIVGMAGLVSLVHHNWHNHRVVIITAVFAAVVFGTAIVLAAFVFCGDGGIFASGVVGFGTIFSLISVLSAFYSDWILAAVMGNMTGVPSSDVAPLYFTYFLAKRIPFFSL